MNHMIDQRLKELRRQRKVTQGQVAEYAGIRQSTLSDLETGKIAPKSLDVLYNISKHYGVSLDWLFGLSDDPAPPAVDNKELPAEAGELVGLLEQLSVFRQRELLAIARSLVETEQEERDHTLDLEHFDRLSAQLSDALGVPQSASDAVIAMLSSFSDRRLTTPNKSNQRHNQIR